MASYQNITTIEQFFEYYGQVPEAQHYIVNKALNDAFNEIVSMTTEGDIEGDIELGLITAKDKKYITRILYSLAGWLCDNGYLQRQGTLNANFQGKSISEAVAGEQQFNATLYNQMAQTSYYSTITSSTKKEAPSNILEVEELVYSSEVKVGLDETISQLSQTQREANIEVKGNLEALNAMAGIGGGETFERLENKMGTTNIDPSKINDTNYPTTLLTKTYIDQEVQGAKTYTDNKFASMPPSVRLIGEVQNAPLLPDPTTLQIGDMYWLIDEQKYAMKGQAGSYVFLSAEFITRAEYEADKEKLLKIETHTYHGAGIGNNFNSRGLDENSLQFNLPTGYTKFNVLEIIFREGTDPATTNTWGARTQPQFISYEEHISLARTIFLGDRDTRQEYLDIEFSWVNDTTFLLRNKALSGVITNAARIYLSIISLKLTKMKLVNSSTLIN